MVNLSSSQIYTRLNNGIQMPLLGLGVYDMYGTEAEHAVAHALSIGYRLIDTAALYRNETEIGNAVRQSGIPRSEIFITTKVASADQGFDNTLRAYDASLKKLKMDYTDLYLVHWPVKKYRKDTWRAFEKLSRDKQVRAIGVANYLLPFLDELETYAEITPAVNQVELSPYLYSAGLVKRCREKSIQLQAYTPLIRGKKFNDPRLLELAARYGKSPAQILLRWAIDQQISTIPKSVTPARIEENFDVFDFQLSAEDITMMNGFNEDFRVCEDPMELL